MGARVPSTAPDPAHVAAAAADLGCPSGLAPADRPERDLQADPAAFVRTGADGAAELELIVRGARCAGCIGKIESGVLALNGVSHARLNLSTGKLAVRFDAALSAPRAVTEALSDLGYASAPYDPEAAGQAVDDEGRMLLRCLAVAGFAAANVMLLSVSVWAGHSGEMDQTTRGLFHWISALIAMPAAAYAGRPFYASAWRALKARQLSMDVPITLGVTLALGLSVYETLHHGVHAYFDAAVMLLFFLLIGRYLDHRLRGGARAAARDLLALQAATANRVEADGAVAAVPAKAVQPGDVLLIAPGERAPVDAVIERGRSDIDRSLATGESAPVPLGPGDMLHSGVVNLTTPLTVRASARAADSFLADLARLLEAGEQAKTRYVRLADRAARLYAPLVHVAAFSTFAGWALAGAPMRDAVTNAIALLIITCPCALGLAVPAVQVVASGRLFRRGVLVKTGDALERLAAADHAVFDKTGTLTLGRLALRDADQIPPETLAAAAALSRVSRHPISRAVVSAAGPGPAAIDVEEIPGAGLEATIDGTRVRFGRAEFAGGDAADETGPSAWLQIGDAAAVPFRFTDAARPDAAETLAALRTRGLDVEMLTGDASGPAARLASELDVSAWRAQASPKDKADRLDTLAGAGKQVWMVGDGLNDAPALARAHVSMSPGAAAEASQNAADFVFQGDSLAAAVEAYDTARAAKRRIQENFALAALYNVIAVPIAAAGLVTPLIAAVAMSASSIVVTLNALRLAGRR